VAKHSAEEAGRVVEQLTDPQVDPVTLERQKIRGAIRTDFILSAEIIVLTLGVVEASDLITQLIVLSGIASLMTVGVYGLVAGIVKIDDLGVLLLNTPTDAVAMRVRRWFGQGLLWFAPRLMRGLSIVGTVAMFLVGGGILMHGSHTVGSAIEQGIHRLGVGEVVLPTLVGGVIGLVAGLALVKLYALLPLQRGDNG
jgi:predicted DNA repair protein MutK